MEVEYSPSAQEDIDYWKRINPKFLEKIEALIANIKITPFTGMGKPEPLKFGKGYWSRRISDFHRLLYKIEDGKLYVLQCRYHYGK